MSQQGMKAQAFQLHFLPVEDLILVSTCGLNITLPQMTHTEITTVLFYARFQNLLITLHSSGK